MMQMWSQFARTGDPNIAGPIKWPTWEPDKDQYLYVTESPQVKSGFSKVAQK
jgi:para-nitrobenzyl esterase